MAHYRGHNSPLINWIFSVYYLNLQRNYILIQILKSS